MSQGARNCPFLTLTARPVRAAATRRSVWRQRKAGICRTSTASATRRALVALVHVGDHRQAERLADFGEDRQRRLEAEPARARSPRCGWPCRTRTCRRGRFRAAPRSPSAPPPSPAHARGSPSGRGRRSARAAVSRRTGPRAAAADLDDGVVAHVPVCSCCLNCEFFGALRGYWQATRFRTMSFLAISMDYPATLPDYIIPRNRRSTLHGATPGRLAFRLLWIRLKIMRPLKSRNRNNAARQPLRRE